MSMSDASFCEYETEHGLLIAFGEFAQQTQLLRGLMTVRIPQKVPQQVGAIVPQTKLVELCAGLLSGIEYLQDLSLGHHPLTKDPAAAEAWGQVRFVHYSNVSRTLDACDELTVSDVHAVLVSFNRPFISEAIHDELCAGHELVFDLDLMGQAVSATSQSYSAASFGWMDDQLRLGYQLARVCVWTARYGRIWLEGFHHPGATVSINCLKELVLAAELQSGVRPRRRPELVSQRIAQLQSALQRLEDLCARQTAARTDLQSTLNRQQGRLYYLEQLRRPRAAQARKVLIDGQISTVRRLCERLQTKLKRGQVLVTRHSERLGQLRAEQERLQLWRTQLAEDNRLNPDAPICVCRTDAGFCSAETVTWQIEMGYQVETKSPSAKLSAALRTRCGSETLWTRVGDNAEMLDWNDYYLKACVYPLRVGLERFRLGAQTKYSTLILYRDTPEQPTRERWFHHYNSRQLIEAGNKQMKTVHHVQHLMSRAQYGIQIQVLLTGLVCNLTQFIQPWLQSTAAKFTPRTSADLSSPKMMVRILANSSAVVQRTSASTVVIFAPTSARPDFKLCLRGVPFHQLNLGLFQPVSKSA